MPLPLLARVVGIFKASVRDDSHVGWHDSHCVRLVREGVRLKADLSMARGTSLLSGKNVTYWQELRNRSMITA